MALELFMFGNRVNVNTFTYAGGEVSVKIDTQQIGDDEDAYIVASLHNSDDVMSLLMLTDALRQIRHDMVITVYLGYVPYARQDRVCNIGEALSVKVFANLINAQNYAKVIIDDPHSDVTPALLDRCEVRSQVKVFTAGAKNLGIWAKGKDNIVLVSPDAGANKKVGEFAKYFGIKDIVRADKKRDPATGKILETVVYSEHVGDKDFLIVDDICDGGRTFLELAKVLRPLTTGKIILYVTHGIFSKGLEPFEGLIDEVYAANPWNLVEWKPFTNLLGKPRERSTST